MTDTPQVLLQHHLKKLRLPTFHSEYAKQARQCAVENKDHINYLLRLCELELIERERRMIERRIKAAKFPATKSLPSQACCACPAGQRISFNFKVIPTVIDQNPCAHLRMPRDMIFHGWSMRLFQAWQHSATMSS